MFYLKKNKNKNTVMTGFTRQKPALQKAVIVKNSYNAALDV